LNRDPETGKAEIVDPSWKLWHHSYGNFYEEIPSLIDIVEEGGNYVVKLRDIVLGIGSKSSFTFAPIDSHEANPLANARSTNEVKDFNWDVFKYSDRYLEFLRKKAEYLHRSTDYVLVYSLAGRVHAWAQALRGWTRWLSDLRLRKPLANAVLDHIMDVVLYNTKKLYRLYRGVHNSHRLC
jgi:hypothetical protein